MINTANVIQEAVNAASWMHERITEIGKTADGWILCTSESGTTLFKEPTTGELINPSA